MIDASQKVYDFLLSINRLVEVVGNRVYPVQAKELAEFPFAVYRLGDVRSFSKDSSLYPVSLGVYFETDHVLTAMDLSDIIRGEVENGCFEFESTSVDSDYETGVGYLEINFNLIK